MPGTLWYSCYVVTFRAVCRIFYGILLILASIFQDKVPMHPRITHSQSIVKAEMQRVQRYTASRSTVESGPGAGRGSLMSPTWLCSGGGGGGSQSPSVATCPPG